MEAAYFLLGILWFIYFGLHSLLARATVKKKVQLLNPGIYRYYRLLYNLLAVVGLAGILFYLFKVQGQVWFSPMPEIRFIALVLASWGVILIRLSFKQYDVKEFLGFGQAVGKAGSLRTAGLLKYVRHPMYAGTIVLLLGFWLYIPTTANAITVLCAVIYILIGIRLEERSLIREYGEAYRRYQKRVPMLVPSFKRNYRA